MRKKIEYYIAVCCLIISIISMFMPIVSYKVSYGYQSHYFKTNAGASYSFNIIDLIRGSEDFNQIILVEYKGPVVWNITRGMCSILGIIAVLAIVCAAIGLFTLRVQRPNTRQFILTIVGLIGIAVPSVVIIVVVFMCGKYYSGTLSCGIAPILSPIAMLVSLCAVIRRKNKVAEALRKEMEEKGLIRQAKDL